MVMKAELNIHPEGKYCLQNIDFIANIAITTHNPEKRTVTSLTDLSGSMGGSYQEKTKLERAQDFLRKFTKELSPDSHIGFITFCQDVNLYFNTKKDFKKLSAQIESPVYDTLVTQFVEKYRNRFFRKVDDPRNLSIINSFAAGGMTAGGGALATARVFADSIKSDEKQLEENKQIVVLSDGMFNIGLGTLEGNDVRKMDVEFIKDFSKWCEETNTHPTMIYIPTVFERSLVRGFRSTALYSPAINLSKLEKGMKEIVLGRKMRENSPRISLSSEEAIKTLQQGFGSYGTFLTVPSLETLPSIARDLSTCSTKSMGEVTLKINVDGGKIETVYHQGEEEDVFSSTYTHVDELRGIRNAGISIVPEKDMKITVKGEYRSGGQTKKLETKVKIPLVSNENIIKYENGLNELSRNAHSEFGESGLKLLLPYLHAL